MMLPMSYNFGLNVNWSKYCFLQHVHSYVLIKFKGFQVMRIILESLFPDAQPLSLLKDGAKFHFDEESRNTNFNNYFEVKKLF